MGAPERVFAHIDAWGYRSILLTPLPWGESRKSPQRDSLGAGGPVGSLPPPEMFTYAVVITSFLANSGTVFALIRSKLNG
jgi:hypothetical protein